MFVILAYWITNATDGNSSYFMSWRLYTDPLDLFWIAYLAKWKLTHQLAVTALYRICAAGDYDIEGMMLPCAYARFAESWMAEGATIVGGCCGIGPEHMTKVACLNNKRAQVWSITYEVLCDVTRWTTHHVTSYLCSPNRRLYWLHRSLLRQTYW